MEKKLWLSGLKATKSMQEGKLTTVKIDYESYASVKKLRLWGLGRKRAQIQARKAFILPL